MPRIREYSGYGSDRSTEDDDRKLKVVRVGEPDQAETEEKTCDDENKTSMSMSASERDSGQKSEPSVAANSTPAAANSTATTIEKIVRPEKDLNPKYTSVNDAVLSVLQDGEYYEDYARGEKAELLKNKDFVLAALAQNYNRFYAPETPKPSDWLDEEYLTERIGYYFERTRESVKQEENAVLAEELYSFLRKNAFSPESYQILNNILKLVAKSNSSRILSPEDGERFKASLARFNSGVNNALSIIKEKHAAALTAEKERAEKLASDKKDLTSTIDKMTFEF